MKNIGKFFSISVLTSCVVFSSQAIELIAGDNSSFTQLCLTAASGNRAATYNAIKSSGYSHQYIVRNVQCNSADLISFVERYGKNTDNMVRALSRRETHVSISDLAMLARHNR